MALLEIDCNPSETPEVMFGEPSDRAADANIALTLFSNDGRRPLSKNVNLDNEGRLIKVPAADMAAGTFKAVWLRTIDQWADIISRPTRARETHRAAAYGVHPEQTAGIITSKGRGMAGAVTRTKENFPFRVGMPGIFLGDIDPGDMMQGWRVEHYDALLCQVCPWLAPVKRFYIPSASSEIYDRRTGQRVSAKASYHLHFAVDDASRIKAIGEGMCIALIEAGYGWVMLSKGPGRMLLRTVLDAAVWQGERLDFCYGPVLPEYLEHRPTIAWFGHEPVLRTASLGREDFATWRKTSPMVQQLLAAAKPASEARADAWEAERVAAAVASGVPEAEARKTYHVARQPGEMPTLLGNFMLHHRGGTVTVDEMLRDRERWHDTRDLCDPFEPGYAPAGVATAFLLGQDHFPTIRSMAHGGITYRLEVSAGVMFGSAAASSALPPTPSPCRPFAEIMGAVQNMMAFSSNIDGVAFLQAMGPILDDLARGDYSAAEFDIATNGLKDASGGKIKIGTIRGELEKRKQALAEQRAAERRAKASVDELRREQILAGLKTTAEGLVASSVSNALLYIQADSRWDGALAYDEFANNIVVRKPLPWHRPADQSQWCDADTTHLHIWLQQNCRGLETIARGTIEHLPAHIAGMNAFHPVRDYLRSLHWDGVARLNSFAEAHLAVEPEDDVQALYLRAVSARFFIGAVARVMQPGCKRDETLIIESDVQGFKKSTLLKAIATRDEWFSDSPIDIGSKDGMQVLRGVWLYAMSELDALSRKDAKTAKSFLTSAADRFRPPFGRHVDTFKRQCVLVGSTNEREYLRDQTGNRRYWPINITQPIDLDRLRADIHQLWAEAFVRYSKGEQWWLTDAEEDAARREQDDRLPHDEMTAEVLEAARKIKNRTNVEYVTAAQLLIEIGMVQHASNDRLKGRIGNILKRAKFYYARPKQPIGMETRQRVYFYPNSWSTNIIQFQPMSKMS